MWYNYGCYIEKEFEHMKWGNGGGGGRGEVFNLDRDILYCTKKV